MILISLIYILICLFFFDNTYREGEIAGGGWDHMRIIGLAACLFWPLLIFYAMVCVYRGRQAN